MEIVVGGYGMRRVWIFNCNSNLEYERAKRKLNDKDLMPRKNWQKKQPKLKFHRFAKNNRAIRHHILKTIHGI